MVLNQHYGIKIPRTLLEALLRTFPSSDIGIPPISKIKRQKASFGGICFFFCSLILKLTCTVETL
jgi:hypothetical protein